jgi:anti-sigma B factor antagonist
MTSEFPGPFPHPPTSLFSDRDVGPPTSFTVRAVNGYAIVEARGEIDLYTSPWLREAVLEALGSSAHVIVDLAAVTFIDSTGLGVLVSAQKRAENADGTMCLAGPAGLVAKVLRVTHLDRAFTIHANIETALTTNGQR